MSAIRLARAATGRKIVIKFEGCYHGHADGLLVKAGSGVATFGIPGSAGVPEEIAALTHASALQRHGRCRVWHLMRILVRSRQSSWSRS